MPIPEDIFDDEENLNAPISVPKKVYTKVPVRRIFVPGKRDMKIEYPELADMEAFTAMYDKDIRFCWYYACKSSEYASIDDNNLRMQKSLEKVYGKDYLLNNATAKKLAIFDIPEHIRVGIEAMSNFSPQHRSQANAMMQKMFENLQKTIDVDEEAFEIWNPSERKAYVQLVSETTDALPNIIAQLERGFSIKMSESGVDKSESQEEHSKLMDEIMDESIE